MISFTFWFEIINVVREVKSEGGTLNPNIFLPKAESVVDAAAVNFNGIKTLLVNGLSTFSIKGNLIFSNGPKCLYKSPPSPLIVLFFANEFLIILY